MLLSDENLVQQNALGLSKSYLREPTHSAGTRSLQPLNFSTSRPKYRALLTKSPGFRPLKLAHYFEVLNLYRGSHRVTGKSQKHGVKTVVGHKINIG